MNSDNLILMLIMAIVVSKVIIGFLIYYLVKRNKELKSDRKSLNEKNNNLNNNLKIIELQKQKLKENEVLKLKILSIASHDILTPFNDLKLMLENLNLMESNPDILINSMKDLKSHFVNIKENLDNILIWATANLKDPENNPQELFNINEHLHEAVSLFNSKIKQKDISIECNFSNDHYSIGNVETFKFTIRNLLNNAIKFSPIGSKIEIKIIENGNVGKVSIQDFGIGMDHKRIEKIISGEFQYSELGTNAEKGSGIGLALCNELLQKQGWKLNIESLIGIGTEIHLILPINNSKNLEKGKFLVN